MKRQTFVTVYYLEISINNTKLFENEVKDMINNEAFSGSIQVNDTPIHFYCHDGEFSFNFMDPFPTDEDGNQRQIELSPNDGFLIGKTHRNQKIALYCGMNPIHFYNVIRIPVNLYIVSRSENYNDTLDTFTGIKFIGKSLNKAFEIKSLSRAFKAGKEEYIINDDSISFDVQTNIGSFQMTIRSEIRYLDQINSKGITNDTVSLCIEFEEPQPLRCFLIHYEKIQNIISFFSNRFEVGFDKITLLNKNEPYDYTTETARVFINESSKATNKQLQQTISFNDLGECLPELIKVFYNNVEHKPSISLGFYPENDNDRIMTSSKVREICSGVECELSFADDIQTENNDNLLELISHTKQLIKGYRKANPGTISDNTYSLIFSSLGNWSNSLAERIWCLYQKFFIEMDILNRFTGYDVKEEDIKQFVKYRNDITHGSHRVLDHNIACTALTLSGLVYCSIFDRIGMDRKKIRELCVDKLLR